MRGRREASRGRQRHLDDETAVRAGLRGDRAVVGGHDRADDRQAEAGTGRVVEVVRP